MATYVQAEAGIVADKFILCNIHVKMVPVCCSFTEVTFLRLANAKLAVNAKASECIIIVATTFRVAPVTKGSTFPTREIASQIGRPRINVQCVLWDRIQIQPSHMAPIVQLSRGRRTGDALVNMNVWMALQPLCDQGLGQRHPPSQLLLSSQSCSLAGKSGGLRSR